MDREPNWLRIAELERRSGVRRRTIHFYLRAGLLHPPVRTARTMAYYDANHLERLALIRRAREQGLPLVAIRGELAAMEAAGTRRPSEANRGPGSAQAPAGARHSGKQGGSRMREDILDLGCRVIREKGYRGTRVSDITRELGIGKGTFYFYFSDKKELFLECVPRIFAELFSRGWDRIRTEANPRRRLELRAQAVLPVLQEFSTILQLCNEALEDQDPKLKRLGEQTYLSVRKPLETDITKGIAAGLFRGADPRLAATLLIGIMNGLRFVQTVDREPLSERTWKQVLELILHGMLAPGHGEKKRGP